MQTTVLPSRAEIAIAARKSQTVRSSLLSVGANADPEHPGLAYDDAVARAAFGPNTVVPFASIELAYIALRRKDIDAMLIASESLTLRRILSRGRVRLLKRFEVPGPDIVLASRGASAPNLIGTLYLTEKGYHLLDLLGEQQVVEVFPSVSDRFSAKRVAEIARDTSCIVERHFADYFRLTTHRVLAIGKTVSYSLLIRL